MSCRYRGTEMRCSKVCSRVYKAPVINTLDYQLENLSTIQLGMLHPTPRTLSVGLAGDRAFHSGCQ